MTSKTPWARPAKVDSDLSLYKEDPDTAHHQDLRKYGIDHPVPILLLTTTGWKSGEQRTTPVNYQKVDGNFVIIASKGGYVDHPHWYLNLKKDPNAEIQVAREHYRVRARDAVSPEREKLWDVMLKIFPPYANYAATAEGREIPVVVLEPVK